MVWEVEGFEDMDLNFDDDESLFISLSSDEDTDDSLEELQPGLPHDKRIHHPRSFGLPTSYTGVSEQLFPLSEKKRIIFNITARVDASPHVGNIFTWTAAFLAAHRLAKQSQKEVSMLLDVETTKTPQQHQNLNSEYQGGLSSGETDGRHIEEVQEIMHQLQRYTGIKCRIRRRKEVLDDPVTPRIIQEALLQQRRHSVSHSPSHTPAHSGVLIHCPIDGCSHTNSGAEDFWISFQSSKLCFTCPEHGDIVVDISSADGLRQLEFDDSFWNIVRAKYHANDPDADWVHVGDSDSSASYPFHRPSEHSPFFLQTPFIVDWSGARISKALHISNNAYGYLKGLGLDYLLSFHQFRSKEKDLQVIIDEVANWLRHPYKLSRSYSLEYVHSLFRREEGRFPLGSFVSSVSISDSIS